MDDLKLMRDLGTALDPEGPMPHDRMRARVMTEVTGPAGRQSAGRQPGGRQLGWRRLPGGRPTAWAVPLVAAAALAGIVATVSGPFDSLTPGGDGISVPRADPRALVGDQPVVNLGARTILLAAAEQAGKERSTVPAGSSFVYTRFTGVGWETNQKGKEGTVNWVDEAWYSVDAKHRGLRLHTQDGFSRGNDAAPIGTCPGPVIQDVQNQGFGDPYCEGPGYVADFPTEAGAALKYLRQPRAWFQWTPFLDGQPGSAAQRATDDEVFLNAWLLLRDHQLSPASRAAIFKALAALPGMQVVPEVTAADGRVGVAVVRVDKPADDGSVGRQEVIFDRNDHTIIGYRTVLNDPARGIKDRVGANIAVAEKVIVPTFGVRPDGSKAKLVDN